MSETEPSILAQPLDYGTRPKRTLRARTRVAITLFDQGIVSVATYITGVLISRSSPGVAGLYGLVFTLWVVGGEVLNSVVSTPQMLKLPRLNAGRARAFNGSLLLHGFGLSALLIVLLLLASGVTFLIHHFTGSATLEGYPLVLAMGALSIGPITLRNFARNACFAAHESLSALTIDVTASVVQVGGVATLFFMGAIREHWWLAVVVVAVANLLSGVMWLSMSRDKLAPDVRRARIDLRRNWITSRPIFASTMLWTAGMQAYPWMIAGIAGKPMAGVWLACFQLASLGNPLLLGVQNFMGPAIAHAYTDRDAQSFRKYIGWCTLIYLVIVLPACIAMTFLAEPLLTHTAGGKYTGFGHVTAILAFTMLMQGISFPTSRGLFSLNRAGVDMLANIGPIVVLAVAGPIMIGWRQVLGAAICLIFAQFIGSVARGIAFIFVSRPKDGMSIAATVPTPTVTPEAAA